MWHIKPKLEPRCDFDEIKKYFRGSVGKIVNQRLVLSPNPARLNLHVEGILQGSFEMYNTHGSLIQNGILEKEISVSDLVPGFYYLLLRNENGVYSGKFVKE